MLRSLPARGTCVFTAFADRSCMNTMSDRRPASSNQAASVQSSSAPPAGWYSDPEGDERLLRYWDGAAWAAHTALRGQVADGQGGVVGTAGVSRRARSARLALIGSLV